MKRHLYLTALAISALSTPLAHGQANDNFANAEAISGDTGSTTGSNIGATLEANEPEHNEGYAGASVWYTWGGSVNGGVFTFTTEDSNFDTVISVYKGNSLGSLEFVAENDENDALGDSTSIVTFAAAPGQVYHIAVLGYAGPGGAAYEGTISLAWAIAPPPPQGKIAVYKEVFADDSVIQGTEEFAPPVQISTSTKGSFSTYIVYDIENGRTATVRTWSEKISGVTSKFYSVQLELYNPNEISRLPFTIFPSRLPNTFHWVNSYTFSRRESVQPDVLSGFLGSAVSELSLWSQYGLATPLKIDATMTISVPAVIGGSDFGHSHRLSSSHYEDDPDLGSIEVYDDHFTKEYSRYLSAAKSTLDKTLTIASNTTDFPSGQVMHQKRTVENAVARVVSALKKAGHVEGYAGGYY